MKLFLYDVKHENVFGEKDLGNLTPSEIELLERVVEFLEEKEILSRYRTIRVAESWKQEEIFDEGDPIGEYEINFI